MYVWDRETLKHSLHDHLWVLDTGDSSSHPMFLLPGKAPSGYLMTNGKPTLSRQK